MYGKAALLFSLLPCAGLSATERGNPELSSTEWSTTCTDWDDWDKPAPPFLVHGKTYYVGTCGIASLLIETEAGLVLIDTGTEAGAKIVRRNIEALGFNVSDIKVILTSHEHFDHVGGLAKMQDWSGAVIMTSHSAVPVLATGIAAEDDPQHGMHQPMTPVDDPIGVDENSFITVGTVRLQSIATPGHTPGALSWWWDSCHGATCARIVYADSLSPVSRDNYEFSDNPDYVASYREGLARLSKIDCDILLTPHPSSSLMPERLTSERGLLGKNQCEVYPALIEARLDKRIAEESGTGPEPVKIKTISADDLDRQ